MSAPVVVIGAGALGLTTALQLAKAGARVVLLERDKVGRGCSAGNAGWVTPAIALPIAAPGLRAQGLRWFLKPDSPLYVKPSALPKLAPWLWRFWKRCTAAAFDEATDVLLRFARDTVGLYEELAAECLAADGAPGVEWNQDGLLMVFRTRAALAAERSLLAGHAYGPVEELDAEGVCAMEPSLPAGRYLGGLHIEPEGHVEPESLTRALARRCRSLGVEIREGFRVDEIRLDPARRTALAVRGVGDHGRGRSEEIEGSEFVITTGAEAGRLAAACGTRLPLQAGKGYSITFERPELVIRRPLYLAEAKVGISPFRDSLRLAGTLELSGINTRLDRRRLAGFERAAERELPGIARGEGRSEWVGMRPMTPDGLPVIGRLPTTENVWVNSGHQMLGITLAPASARLLAQLMLGSAASGLDAPSLAFLAAALSPARYATS